MSKSEFRNIKSVYDSSCGLVNSESDKKWIVDIDDKNRRFVNEVLSFIEQDCKPIGLKFISLIETKNGFHLITKPFDLETFKKTYSEIEVHKNNPTLLYVK